MQVIELVCDAADLTSTWGAEAPDVLIVAGFALPSSDSAILINLIRKLKSEVLGDQQCPIKWNMKDVQRALELHGLEYLKPHLLKHSDRIRASVLDHLVDAKATIFVSAIQAYSNRKQVLGRTREDLVSFSFGNLLMRAGLWKASQHSNDQVQLVLDWPEKGNRTPFVEEYRSAWRNGRSTGGEPAPTYKCGPLSGIGFRSAPVFGVTDLDERLQISDLVVGASRVFVNYCFGAAGENDFGVEQFRRLCKALWRPGFTLGRGFTAAPANSPFSSAILEGLQKLGC